MAQFQKYKDKSKRNAPREQVQTEVVRARIPRGNEVLGIVEQRVGANRMVINVWMKKKEIAEFQEHLKEAFGLDLGIR